jgi:phosphoribosyl-ATP pyrophosphohydrolase
MSDTLDALWRIIVQRKETLPSGSYTTSLFEAGVPRIARKVGEEGVETAVAALSETPDRMLSEMADLLYHCLVLLAARDLTLAQLEAELASRFKSAALGGSPPVES